VFKRKLLFVETDVLQEVLPYLKRTLNLVDVEILSVEEALEHVVVGKAGYSRMIVESSEPGSPAFEFRNV
jgi:leucyl-tRNA synthetase